MNENNSNLEKPLAPKPPVKGRVRRYFADHGSALITDAADNQPSAIWTYSVTGASFGYLPSPKKGN